MRICVAMSQATEGQQKLGLLQIGREPVPKTRLLTFDGACQILSEASDLNPGMKSKWEASIFVTECSAWEKIAGSVPMANPGSPRYQSCPHKVASHVECGMELCLGKGGSWPECPGSWTLKMCVIPRFKPRLFQSLSCCLPSSSSVNPPCKEADFAVCIYSRLS